MKVIIKIPEEFEKEFKEDHFSDSLNRLLHDAHCLAGNYEKETARMLIRAFEEAKEVSAKETSHEAS